MSGVCSVDGCDRPVAARGWCINHYRRWWRRGGDPAVDHKAGRPADPNPTELLPAECWCMAEIVHVSPAQVRAGETNSCGRPGCEDVPPHPRGERR